MLSFLFRTEFLLLPNFDQGCLQILPVVEVFVVNIDLDFLVHVIIIAIIKAYPTWCVARHVRLIHFIRRDIAGSNSLVGKCDVRWPTRPASRQKARVRRSQAQLK
jgi:hypothetical protein